MHLGARPRGVEAPPLDMHLLLLMHLLLMHLLHLLHLMHLLVERQGMWIRVVLHLCPQAGWVEKPGLQPGT